MAQLHLSVFGTGFMRAFERFNHLNSINGFKLLIKIKNLKGKAFIKSLRVLKIKIKITKIKDLNFGPVALSF